MMPSKDISSEQLLNKLINYKQPHKVVPFPREENGQPIGYLAMTVLTEKDEIECNEYLDSAMRMSLKKKGLDVPKDDEHAESYHNLYSMKQAVEILFKACRQSEDVEKKFFSTREQIAQYLTKTEIAILMKQYIMVQAELGPIISRMSSAEMDAWIDRLAMDNDDRFFLSYLSLEATSELVMHLVSRLTNSQMDNGSAGLQPENIVDVV